MTVFITGGTGFLGSYVVDTLMRERDERLLLLTRGADPAEAEAKLWKALQLHMSPDRFRQVLDRIDLISGDITAPGLGLSAADRARIVREATSVLHIAASLNRRSEKACLNANLRGTLSVVKLAREIADAGRLRRFSQVSTTAVSGRRERTTVREDEAIDWARSDYDPYGRTKKMAEHITRELLPDVPLVFFRPSTVMGDSRFPETTQFDMVRAFCFFADLPAVPMAASTRQDIVNADWVGKAIARLHTASSTRHDIYNLSAGESSCRSDEIAETLAAAGAGRGPRFMPALKGPFEALVDGAARMRRRNGVQLMASLLKVFLPYVTNDVVFDNSRAVEELGEAPVPLTRYGTPLYRWAKENRFRYPYRPLPAPSPRHDHAAPVQEVV